MVKTEIPIEDVRAIDGGLAVGDTTVVSTNGWSFFAAQGLGSGTVRTGLGELSVSRWRLILSHATLGTYAVEVYSDGGWQNSLATDYNPGDTVTAYQVTVTPVTVYAVDVVL